MEVPYEELDYVVDSRSDGCVYLFQGKPFTGVAVEHFKTGAIRCTIQFRDGLENGNAKEYYRSGALLSSSTYTCGRVVGRVTEWFESGAIKKQEEFSKTSRLWSRVYDETGQIIEEAGSPPS